ncbi:hypothetical protein [Cognatitamlana onchidii]|uniref:hypothetical protein n=1 Tax=Cognatitamlana onchidii TaxID=2562860 RepID=UPI0010A66235|nr:hypothetical protein [Algibacter onchidii]
MLARWGFSLLVVLFALFGILSQEQRVVPNQEIVLQFEDVDVTSQEAKHTISLVKTHLMSMGVENIQVKALENGHLKISYYSHDHISIVKENFSNDIALLGFTTNSNSKEKPLRSSEEQGNIAVNFDIYEIQSELGSGWGVDGTVTLPINVKSDRFLEPNVILNSIVNSEEHQQRLIKLAYKVCQIMTFSSGELVYAIPEVRAGPLS